jgi:hypothetical protein
MLKKSSPKKVKFQKQSLFNNQIELKNLFKLYFEIIEHFIHWVEWVYDKLYIKFEKKLYKKNEWKICSKLIDFSRKLKYFFIKILISYD